jgi:hypothetical protein
MSGRKGGRAAAGAANGSGGWEGGMARGEPKTFSRNFFKGAMVLVFISAAQDTKRPQQWLVYRKVLLGRRHVDTWPLKNPASEKAGFVSELGRSVDVLLIQFHYPKMRQ